MSWAFSQESYDEFDKRGKMVAISFFESMGYFPTKKEEDRQIDLIFEHSDPSAYPILYVEVEVRGLWNFPLSQWSRYKPGWDTIHIPDRKAKYSKWYGNQMFYFELNFDYSEAFIVPGRLIKPEYRKMIPNRRHRRGEYFYDIPVKELKIVKIPSFRS